MSYIQAGSTVVACPSFIGATQGYAPALSADFLTTTALPSWITYSGASLATLFDSTGKLTFKPNNLLTYSNTFDNAAWTASSVTVAPGASDPLGGTTAYTLTASGANGTVTQTAAAGAKPYNILNAIWIKRKTGTGNIQLSDATGALTTLTVTTSWTQVYQGYVGASSTGTFQIKIVTSGDAVYVYAATQSAVTYETTPRTGDQQITTSAAYYGPRFDYDPSTLAAKGLLIEEARTNSATYSNTFSDVSWAQANVTSITQNATSPTSGTTAWTLIADGVGACTLTKTVTLTTGNTLSIFAKAGTDNFIYLTQTDAGGSKTSYFNVSTGALGTQNVTSAGAPTIAQSGGSITAIGNSWYRIAITSSGASVTSFAIGMSDADNSTTVTAAKTTIIYGAQFELGSFATSYIPTAASAVARSADTLNSTSFMSSYRASASSIVVELQPEAVATLSVFTVDDGTFHHRFQWIDSGVAGQFRSTGEDDGGTFNINNNWGTVTTAVKRLGVAAATNDFAAYEGGTQQLTLSNSGTLPTAVTTARWGASYGGTAPLYNGWLRGFAYYNSRLPNPIIQSKSVVGAGY